MLETEKRNEYLSFVNFMVHGITCFQSFSGTRREADQTYVNDYKYILHAMNSMLQH